MSESSIFLATGQTEANSQESINYKPVPEFYTAGDIAERLEISVTTAKRIATELRLDPVHTAGGLKLFTAAQLEKIKHDWARRQQEASR